MHLVFLFTENKWNHFFLCTCKGNKTETDILALKAVN